MRADKPINRQFSGDAKEELISKNDLKSFFTHKTVIIPHDDKKLRGGEDAAATTDDWLVGELVQRVRMLDVFQGRVNSFRCCNFQSRSRGRCWWLGKS